MEYSDFLKTKKKTFIESGFEVKESSLNKYLFDFQKFAVKTALLKGRFAFFFDCGLGKSLMQLAWCEQVFKKTKKKCLILAPLAVVEQTKEEAIKFGINLKCFDITNYEQLENIDISIYSGVVLDESSILKGKDGKRSALIIDTFKGMPYKLACTATPSPNDHMELGQHSEFLGAMSYLEMLAMYFVHDGGETSKWRLRKHATDPFWKYVCTWSMACDKPDTLGFCHNGYDLPEIEFIEHTIKVENNTGSLFADVAVSSTDLHRDLKRSLDARIEKTAELVNNSDEQWIIWTLGNDEADELSKVIKNSINVQGSDKPEIKAKYLSGFAKNEFQNLVTKTRIAAMGMNYQNCHNMVFTSYDFKFEQFYQAVRRCYRFGQKNKVYVHLLVPESQLNVRQVIIEKQKKHMEMITQMALYSANTDYKLNKSKVVINKKEVKTNRYHLFNGDCVQESKKIENNAADLCVFSPPFAELYVYSDKEEDMGNVSDYNQFQQHFKFLIPEIKRVLKPGRICAIHCMDLPIQKGKEGFIGLRDFSGMLIDWFTDMGFTYHSRVTIWKNPVTEMQRTKALGLLHKTIKKDSSMSRVGIPDYVLFFRNEGENEIPIVHQDESELKPNYLPVDLWQKYASPVWYDIDYSRTLQYRSGRDGNDEKHICLATDTLVLTQKGYIKIQEVEIGDITLTHLGNWKKIIAKELTQKNAIVVQTKAQGVPLLITTPDHKLWCKKHKGYRPSETFIDVEPNWIESQETESHYLNQKLPTVIQSELTNNECWIIGRWLADGHLDHRQHQFFVSIGNSKLEKFEAMAGNYIGASRDNGSCTQIGLKGLSNITREILFKCGSGAENKVLPIELISLDVEKSNYLLEGYLSGDGHTTKAGAIMASSVSRSLLLGLSLVIQRAKGVIASVYAGRKEGSKVIEGRKVNTKQDWILTYKPFGKHTFGKILHDGAWKKVNKVQSKGKSDVWCLQVEDDASFTAEGCIVKNCPLQLDTIERIIHLYSNEGETVFSPFGGIGSEGFAALHLKRNSISIELKESYFKINEKNHRDKVQEINSVLTLF